jgi:hypothetical protein
VTRTIDIPTFQAAVVRNCSPTLAGIKPASLFTYPGTYAHGDGSTTTETIAERRARLLNVIAQCNRELDPLGIHLSVLVWRPCGALVYVYRAKSLATYFADPRAQTALASEGYDTRDLSTCLVHLASRITLASNNIAECACSQTRCALPQQASCSNDCTCEFPHEIGYFLGCTSLSSSAARTTRSLELGRSTRMSSKRLRCLTPTVPALNTSPLSISRAAAWRNLPRQPDRT